MKSDDELCGGVDVYSMGFADGQKAARANPLSDPRVKALWEAAKHYAGWLSDNGYKNNALERSLTAFETKEKNDV